MDSNLTSTPFDIKIWGRWAGSFIGFPLAGLAALGGLGLAVRPERTWTVTSGPATHSTLAPMAVAPRTVK